MPEPEDILAMSESNPDGGGVSWWDGERLRVFKNVDPLKVVGFIYSHWDSLKRAPCLIHFRFATHGAVEPRNCHPFHTDRGYVAHNGIAHDYTIGPYASDSRNMVAAWIDSGYDNTVFKGQGLVALITPPTDALNGLRASRLNTRVAYGFLTCIGASDEFFRACREIRPDIIDNETKEMR
jgi:hypothetical protein